MSYRRFVARRLAVAVASVYVAVTAMFVLANFMWRHYLGGILGQASYNGASDEQLARIRRQFKRERGLDEPVHVRYVEWLVDVTTLNWGSSFEHGKPVVEVLADPVAATLQYVLPGVALAVVLGVLLGLVAALSKDGAFDWSVRLLAYTLFALPAFVLLDYGVSAANLAAGAGVGDALAAAHPDAFASLLVAASLLAGQVRFARTASLEQTGQAFVKLLRAKGTGRVTVARHVLRNASLPIISMSTSEVVSVLALDIYVVEFILPIPGVAEVILAAVDTGDVPVLIWSTMVIVVLGIAGNFLTDLLYGYIDPRVRTD